MQCGEFRTRLDSVVDARRSPEQDRQLSAHARHCPDCAQWMADYGALLDEINLAPTPALGSDFGLGVLQAANAHRQQKKRSRIWIATALSVAASLLIAVFVAQHSQSGTAGFSTQEFQPGVFANSIAAKTRSLTNKQIVLVGEVADGFRPVTSSVYRAFNNLWRALPGSELAHAVL